jgi:hypothetical protein
MLNKEQGDEDCILKFYKNFQFFIRGVKKFILKIYFYDKILYKHLKIFGG